MLLEVGCEDVLVRRTHDFYGVCYFVSLPYFSVINVDVPIGGAHVASAHRLNEPLHEDYKSYGYYVI